MYPGKIIMAHRARIPRACGGPRGVGRYEQSRIVRRGSVPSCLASGQLQQPLRCLVKPQPHRTVFLSQTTSWTTPNATIALFPAGPNAARTASSDSTSLIGALPAQLAPVGRLPPAANANNSASANPERPVTRSLTRPLPAKNA